MKTYKGKTFLPKNVDGVIVELTDDDCEHMIKIEQDAIAYNEKLEQSKTDAKNGNQKLLDLGLTQAEVTAMTGYTPPVEE